MNPEKKWTRFSRSSSLYTIRRFVGERMHAPGSKEKRGRGRGKALVVGFEETAPIKYVQVEEYCNIRVSQEWDPDSEGGMDAGKGRGLHSQDHMCTASACVVQKLIPGVRLHIWRPIRTHPGVRCVRRLLQCAVRRSTSINRTTGPRQISGACKRYVPM